MARWTAKAAAILALVTMSAPVLAGQLEDVLESRWRGAWVLMTTDIYSDCAGNYTRNDVNGELVRSQGRFRFRRGELAQVKDFDLERSGLELALSLPEPLLMSYEDGPFTLYEEVRCLASLDVELPRAVVKGNDPRRIEAALQPLLLRFVSEESATQSRFWNHRERGEYPDDYDRTLARHAAWKAEQTNAAIQARIDQATEEASRITGRVNSDHDYLKGFSAGIEAVRARDLSECDALLSHSFQSIVPKPPQLPAALQGPAAAEFQRGFQDGGRLVFGLESMRQLPKCMVPVPEVPDELAPPTRPRR
ncbi:MAG: hypothetical protein L0191_11535 [Acidobacteria bacterium]|nr:hypothetical protein [Acidobacteriota bacterium]